MNFDKEVPKLASDSDDSDEDYVPAGAESNPPSEDDSDGPEEVESGSEGEGASSKRRRRGNKPSISRKRQCKQATPEELNGDDEDEETEVKKLTEEEEKQKVDALWKDFMKDTGPAAKSAPSRSRPSAPPEDISKNKVKITKVFEFAGEEVRVEKVVSGDSAEARLTSVPAAGPSLTSNRGRGRGGGGLKGLSSVLSQLGRKPKLGTLEKSKLDWENFKSKEGLQDEIHTFNKGKDGYLERQDFLQRTDLRQFELERDLRTTRRSNR